MVKLYSEVLGKVVELPDSPRRVATLSPSITETLDFIGLWGRVAAVSTYCHVGYPKSRGKPAVSAYTSLTPRGAEVIREVDPDLVLVSSGIQTLLARELDRAGYTVFPVPLPRSIYDVLSMVRVVGLVAGSPEAGDRGARELFDRLASLKGSLPPLRTYVELEFAPAQRYSVGTYTHIDSALSFIGLRNVYGGLVAGYVTPNYGYVASRNPEVVIYDYEPGLRRSVGDVVDDLSGKGLGGVKAVVSKAVIIGANYVKRYGPSLITYVLPDIVSKVRSLG
ncbi:MAG: hypothetical protein B6U73_02590 [Desulfurococcales archaeon ex4484_204]|nr:MAG: hypothetical protein B6U73_02590 [Desulfurococcales archaeon ex4484_204]